MKAEERNDLAKQFVLSKLNKASNASEVEFLGISNYANLLEILNRLICVNAKGFRGVVATAITGKHIEPNFDPLNNFYSCNPRSIFEQGIFYAFEEGRIPCGKSDPLNVAKNTYVLDYEWANAKRPQSAAQAAVDYLKAIEHSSGEEQEKIIDLFFFKLQKYANSIAAIEVILPTVQNISHQEIAYKINRFVLEYPESGTIPQLVISKLLLKLYEYSNTVVKGGDESVFGTNTTSNKPADIWLERDNQAFNLFEVTVKKIDGKRLDDCIQSLYAMNMINESVHFICRLPRDISTLTEIENGTLNYKGKTFNFVDISSFINSVITMLSIAQLENLMQELNAFVEKIDRPIKTKEGWNLIFQ